MVDLPDDLRAVQAAMFNVLDLLPRLWHVPGTFADMAQLGYGSLIEAANELPAAVDSASVIYEPLQDELKQHGNIITVGVEAATPCDAVLKESRFELYSVLSFANRTQHPDGAAPSSAEFQAYLSRLNRRAGMPLDLVDGEAFAEWRGPNPRVGYVDVASAKAAIEQQLLRVAAERQRYDAKYRKSPPSYAVGDGCRSVEWYGTLYTFTANQAPVVQMLIDHFERGTPDVGDETLLSAVDPEAPPARLNVLFRGSPAWGPMIVEGATRGTHRVQAPTK